MGDFTQEPFTGSLDITFQADVINKAAGDRPPVLLLDGQLRRNLDPPIIRGEIEDDSFVKVRVGLEKVELGIHRRLDDADRLNHFIPNSI